MRPGPTSPRTYSLSEIEARSGFDKRTIAYYISYGVLPKVGRRGPKTTYPQEFLDRLMFVRRVKELQDAGRLRAVTLRDIGDVLDALDPGSLQTLVAPEANLDDIRTLFALEEGSSRGDASHSMPPFVEPIAGAAVSEPTAATPRMASRRHRRTIMSKRHRSWGDVGEPPAADVDPMTTSFGLEGGAFDGAGPDDALEDGADVEAELTSLLTEVDLRARSSGDPDDDATSERLTRVAITPDVLISVRNISKEDAGLVERLAALLRRLTRRADR